MTVAAGDAHDRPIYAGRYRVVFPLLDADGDLVTAATTPDSEVSIDQGTFADCTAEMTEIATGSGVYYLDLTAAEMTGSCIAVIAKSATAGMKTTMLTLYPRRLPILRSGTAQAGAGSTITLDSGASAKDGAYVGMYVQCSNNSPANVQGMTRKIVSYVGSTKVATVASAWGTNPSSATTFSILIPETVNIDAIAGNEMPDWTTAGVPKVDLHLILGTAVSTPATAGVLDVNVKNAANVAWASGAITAASIAADAITDAKVASDVTIASVTGAVGSVTGAVGSVTGSVGSVATGGIAAASFAAGAINAAAIAADAIGASELAADAVTEIQAGLATAAALATVQADTDDIQARLPAALVSGRMDSSVGAMAASVLTATAIATDAITAAKVAADAVTEIQTGLPTVASITALQADTDDIQARLPAALVSGRIDASVGAMAASVITATAIAADAITDAKVAADVTIASVTGAVGSVTGAVGSVTGAVGSVTGSVGSVTGAVGSVTGNVGGNVTGSVGSVATGGITATSIATDALGALELAADAVTEIANAVWDMDATGHQTQGTFGQAIGDPVADTGTIYKATVTDATLATVGLDVAGLVTTVGAAGAGLTAVPFTNVWSVATRTLTAGTNIVLAKGTGVTGLNDLDAAGVRTAVGLATANLDTQIDALPTNAELATALAAADDAVLAAIAALNNLSAAGVRTAVGLASANLDTQLDALPTNAELTTALGTADDAVLAAIAALNNLSQANVRTAIGLATANLDTQIDALPTAAENADAVWEEVITDHSATVGSTAEALGAAGSAGDPWATALPGVYGAGSAGKIVGDNLNAAVSSRASQTSVDDVPTNAELTTALGTADDAVIAAIAALNDLSQADVRTAVGLASANLDTQLDALPTNAELATALGTADDAVLAAIAALNNLSAAEVNVEMVDVISVDTYAEPGQGAPTATTNLADKMGYLFKMFRNKKEQTATTFSLFADDATTVDQKSTVSDDTVTVTRSEMVSGP